MTHLITQDHPVKTWEKKVAVLSNTYRVKEDEEIEEFEEGPVDVQTSLQANTETTEENEHDDQVFQCRLTHSSPVFL